MQRTLGRLGAADLGAENPGGAGAAGPPRAGQAGLYAGDTLSAPALNSDPLRESALRLLLQSLANNGEIAAVIETYRDFRLNLLRELNAQPAPETVALYQKIRKEAR